MKHLQTFKIFENNDSQIWKPFIERIMKSDFEPITDEIWDSLESEGYTEEVNDYDGDFNRDNYRFVEIELSESDKQGLINMEENIIEKWNDFDIFFKEEGYYPNYLDFIDYDEGKLFIVKHN
jgi:hypothetical protein